MNGTGIHPQFGLFAVGIHAGWCVLLIGLLIQFHRRKHLQPIRARPYWLSELSAVSILLSSTYGVITFELVTGPVCDMLTFYGVLLFAGMGPPLIQAAHLFSVFEVSNQNVRAQIDKLDVSSRRRYFAKYAKAIQNPTNHVVTILMLFVVHLIIWGTIFLKGTGECRGLTEYVMVAGAITPFYLVATLVLGLNVVSVKDGLYIRTEFVAYVTLSAFGVPACILLYYVTGGTTFPLMFTVINSYLLYLVHIGMPLYKTYVWSAYARAYEDDNNRSWSSRKSGRFSSKVTIPRCTPEKLESLLDNERTFAVFLEYCRLQLSHENVLFCFQVRKLLMRVDDNSDVLEDEEFINTVRKIYNSFLSPEAELLLNVSWRQQQFFDQAGFSKVNEDIDPQITFEALKAAYKEIFNLMYHDVFARFARSIEYRKLVESNDS